MAAQGEIPPNVVVLLWPPVKSTSDPQDDTWAMPPGWELVEQQEDCFAMGCTEVPCTGGNPTHSHAWTSTTSSDGQHQHSTFEPSLGVYDRDTMGGRQRYGVVDRNGRSSSSLTTSVSGTHGHNCNASAGGSNVPLFIKLPYIASYMANAVLPERTIIACLQGDVIQPGWSVCDGKNGTPDLSNRFVRGCHYDGFGEKGGDGSHSHTWAAYTSSDGNHYHKAFGSTGCYKRDCDGGSNTLIDTNGRSADGLDTGWGGSHSHYVNGSTSTTPTLPPYWTVAYFMRRPGSGSINRLEDLPPGIILMFRGTVNEVPPGWALCDGKNGRVNLVGRFLLGSSSSLAPNKDGGSIAHSHDVYHSVTAASSHSHSTFDPSHGVYTRKIIGGSGCSVIDCNGREASSLSTAMGGAHPHTIATLSLPLCDSLPPYFGILFLQRI
ncbi:hypothetical protein Pelo_17329 [Pelomyxa schiedti]|nr:hypothetical protein Pelo_17329 [Pelomyxa schiedti]